MKWLDPLEDYPAAKEWVFQVLTYVWQTAGAGLLWWVSDEDRVRDTFPGHPGPAVSHFDEIGLLAFAGVLSIALGFTIRKWGEQRYLPLGLAVLVVLVLGLAGGVVAAVRYVCLTALPLGLVYHGAFLGSERLQLKALPGGCVGAFGVVMMVAVVMVSVHSLFQ